MTDRKVVQEELEQAEVMQVSSVDAVIKSAVIRAVSRTFSLR